VKVRPRGKGRWQLVWELGRDESGRRRQKYETFRGTKAGAERRWVEVQAEIQRRPRRPPAELTVAELVNRWLADVSSTVRPRTRALYDLYCRSRIVPALGPLRAQEITHEHVRVFLDSLSDLSPRTRQIVRSILRQAFSRAVEWGIVWLNPVDAVRPPRAPRPEIQVWTPEEVERFASVAAQHRLWPLFWLLLATGLRVGEALGLRWRDVDLEAGRLSVRHQLGRDRRLSEPKSRRGARVVDIGPDTVDILRRHRRAQAEELLALGLAHPELVFVSEAGTPLLYRNVARSFAELVRKAGVPRIRLHDLRHTHATALLLAGVHPQVVSERLGHASTAFTLATYSHVLPSLQREAAEAVENVLLSGRGARRGADPTISHLPRKKKARKPLRDAGWTGADGRD
jgi:integrase